ncbi:magnesium protoporphyrin IX methyltransferase [Tropicibacter sp. S64]|uniref:magnesium protoporphyrin IX methyltransferase n=1 Tax=Tropicibacter sp. S64 TaxID=3415122 RepID=UPI003C7D666F
MTYARTLARVETYFDQTAHRTWERLTSDAPVSRIRETVRRGRDAMRAQLISRLPQDLHGMRVLDAGCGTGQLSADLAARGAEVVGVDVSPRLIDIAQARLPGHLSGRVTFRAGDMLHADIGPVDFTIAMDSLIYYTRPDLADALHRLQDRTRHAVVFTLAPRTPLLMAMWRVGKLFPRSDRSPVMVPHAHAPLARALQGRGTLTALDRVTSGFYISQALELRP